MDEHDKRLVELIVGDRTDAHTRIVDTRLFEWKRKDECRRRDNREWAKKIAPHMPEDPYENYNKKIWMGLAEFLSALGADFVADLAQAIREETKAAEAGALFRQSGEAFLATLGQKFEKRFNDQRPFIRGMPSKVPGYWDDERLKLNRKLEIEQLKFARSSAAIAAHDDVISEIATPTPSSSSTRVEAWTEARMKQAIADCSIADRDKAWSLHFKATQGDHGWNNTAFRAIWSEARGTKGMTGRPAKSA
jgi:hypothetical protein